MLCVQPPFWLWLMFTIVFFIWGDKGNYWHGIVIGTLHRKLPDARKTWPSQGVPRSKIRAAFILQPVALHLPETKMKSGFWTTPSRNTYKNSALQVPFALATGLPFFLNSWHPFWSAFIFKTLSASNRNKSSELAVFSTQLQHTQRVRMSYSALLLVPLLLLLYLVVVVVITNIHLRHHGILTQCH